MSTWFCTDPDAHQYCKPINDHAWWFCELRYNFKDTDHGVVQIPLVCRGRIELHDYSLDEVWDICSGYYDSFEQMVEQYGFRNALQVMAECIFEQTETCGLSAFTFDSEEEAIKMIEDLVK